MTGLSEGLGTFVTGFSFWAAMAILGVSGLLASSKAVVILATSGLLSPSGLLSLVKGRRPKGNIPKHAPSGGAALLLGSVAALLVVSVPNLSTTMSSQVAGGAVDGEGAGDHRPGVVEYVSTLSPDFAWIAVLAVGMWVSALMATLAAGFARQLSTAE